MACYYLNPDKETLGSGIYCNRYGGHPGNSFWRSYCQSRCSQCPYNDGPDPDGLLQETRERFRVEERIDALPYRVSVSDRAAIQEARRQYDHLGYKQQRFLRNYSKLTEAERALNDALYQERINQTNIGQVEKAIDAIPYHITPSCAHAVKEARRKYDQLSSDLKRQVSNASRLTDAERELKDAQIQEQKEKHQQKNTGVSRDDSHHVEEDPCVDYYDETLHASDDSHTHSSFDIPVGGVVGGVGGSILGVIGSVLLTILGGLFTGLGYIFSWICDIADPHSRSTPIMIKLYRVLVLLVACVWYKGDAGGIPTAVWYVYLALCGISVVSLILSYIATDCAWLRGTFWILGLIALAILVYMTQGTGYGVNLFLIHFGTAMVDIMIWFVMHCIFGV